MAKTRNKKVRVMFVLPSLTAGGAERVMSFLASNIDRDRFISYLVVIGPKEDTVYDVSNVEIVYLNKSKVRYGFFQLLSFIIRKRINLVFSSLAHVNTMMAVYAMFLIKTKFIGRETIVRSAKKSKINSKTFFSFLSKFQQIFLDMMVCQSEDMYRDMIDNHGFKKEKLVIINNPISNEFKLKKSVNSETLQFITVGRIEKHKGHERILKGLKEIDYPFKYIIIGSGNYEDYVFQIVSDYKLNHKVIHIPFTKNVSEYLAKSDCFLSGSYVEGFPNALIESCAVGTPVIAYNAPGGINEIIVEDVNGYIVESHDDYVHHLNLLEGKDWDIEKVRESVISRYSEEIILKKYEELILGLI